MSSLSAQALEPSVAAPSVCGTVAIDARCHTQARIPAITDLILLILGAVVLWMLLGNRLRSFMFGASVVSKIGEVDVEIWILGGRRKLRVYRLSAPGEDGPAVGFDVASSRDPVWTSLRSDEARALSELLADAATGRER